VPFRSGFFFFFFYDFLFFLHFIFEKTGA